MRTMVLAVVLVFAAVAAVGDDAPPVVDGGGATLKSLADGSKLVTVVLKEKGIQDQNLRIVGVGPNYISVKLPNGEQTSYRFSSIQEVRVQEGEVKAKEFSLDELRTLRAEEQKVVDRALDRAREFFEAPNTDQAVKIRAAMLLALNGRKDAEDYLRQLAVSNDIATELDATLSLYLAGAKDIGGALIAEGLDSGNRDTKAKAALLAGILGDQSVVPVLVKMVGDRASDISAPAAKALGRLGYRDVVPRLIEMAAQSSEQSAAAAVFGLARLGGPDVINAVKAAIQKADPKEQRYRYRLALVLYRLGDATGKKLLMQEMMGIPSLTRETAIELAKGRVYDGTQYLTDFLKGRYNDTPEEILLRARAAAALVEGGDVLAVSHLQTLLRTDKKEEVRIKIYPLIAELGKRKLIPLTSPGIESNNASLSIEACCAAVAMAKAPFRERLVEIHS